MEKIMKEFNKRFGALLDPLSLKVSYEAFAQISKDIQNLKNYSFSALDQYYKNLLAKYQKLLVDIKLKQDHLASLESTYPGINVDKGYKEFLNIRIAVLQNKIKRIENIIFAINWPGYKISKTKHAVQDNLGAYVNRYLDYYRDYKNGLQDDKKSLEKYNLHLASGNLIFVKKPEHMSRSEEQEQTYLREKLNARIARAEQRIDRIIKVLEKIEYYVGATAKPSRPSL